MPRSAALTCILAAAALGLLGAEDLEVNDLRLKAGVLDRTYKEASPSVSSSSPTYGTTVAKNAESSHRAELEWCHLAFGDGGGLALGADLAYQQTRFADGDHRTTLSTPVADGVAGYCLRLADPLHLEATLFGGMGRSSGDGASLAALRRGAAYYEYGARLALYATIAGSWQLGVEAPYRVTRSSPTYHYTATRACGSMAGRRPSTSPRRAPMIPSTDSSTSSIRRGRARIGTPFVVATRSIEVIHPAWTT